MNSFTEWGVPIIEWLQNFGDGPLPLMNFFSFLGRENFYLLILVALFWCYDAKITFRAGIILLTSASLVAVLKVVFALPRPYWINTNVIALGTDPYFGMPSGHAQNAVALWGRFASLIRRAWASIGAVLLIFFISLSRLYLGVHFPLDIVGGWIVGLLLLLVFIRTESKFVSWLRNLSFSKQVMVPVVFALAILAVGLNASNPSSDQEIPAQWRETAIAAAPTADPPNPYELDPFVAITGVLMGFGIGGVYLYRWDGFDAGGPIGKRALRYLVGVIGVVILFFGLRMLFPSGSALLPQSLRFLRYASVGLWITYLAPRLFVRLRLA